jgi:hypothetical protein
MNKNQAVKMIAKINSESDFFGIERAKNISSVLFSELGGVEVQSGFIN